MPKIRKVLVSNRGEIAVRIFRACRELNIHTIGVYSEGDRNALHLNYCDEAYLLGDTAPASSYLNIEKILETARRAGADAIHPGYGFLSENSTFAHAVEQAGIVWIGPPPGSIKTMGDKISARRVAAGAGAESVPGSERAVKEPAEILGFANEHGWPVALKAAHGGGGRGFRVIERASEAADAFQNATREALVSFGNTKLYLERYLKNARHIEIQVLADNHSKIIYLAERDCSLQRRHQKLIEESPSPMVGATLREEMGATAVAIARAAGYANAGTVEFLLDEQERYWFLEMNTRLQVEHAVTEMVAGLDLVKAQIRLAQGEPLDISQDDVSFRGHAIECRINAEDPSKGFLPSPGSITAWREPAGPGVRVDAGVSSNCEVPQAYDSLLAKLVCWGENRAEARLRTIRALGEFTIEGISTSVAFHQMVISSKWFEQADFNTTTVEGLDLSALSAKAPASQTGNEFPSRDVDVEVEGKRLKVQLWENQASGYPGRPSRARPAPPDMQSLAALSATAIAAPMQGLIVKVLVEEGQPIAAGDPVLVLEAMKMENIVRCTSAGAVSQVNVREGQIVESGQVLVLLE